MSGEKGEEGDAVPITGRRSGPCAVVIFGASGDLTKRKLLPAFYNLLRQRLLPDEFALIGFARQRSDSQEFRKQMRGDLEEYTEGSIEARLWTWLERRLHYVVGEFEERDAYQRLGEKLSEIAETHGTNGNALFYLASAPRFFAPIVEHLAEAGLTDERDGRWRRVVIEKPFGRDLGSAVELNARLRCVLDERQIYRIDHYLGKETVQNLIVFRFSNGIFEPIWNRRYVSHVQITVAETLGVEGRGGYYDRAGALRDMVPNHIFQLISLVAMEPPISFDADSVRDEQSKVLRAIPPMTPEQVLTKAILGQYGAGTVAGQRLPDYRMEHNVE
jgi:glucose-6-phosphate 1-dehydrogenase